MSLTDRIILALRWASAAHTRLAKALQALPLWMRGPLAATWYFIGKYWDHAVGVVVGASAAFLWGAFFPAATDVYLVQSGLGEHCPVPLFGEAENRGERLVFEPATVRNMAICGPGNHEGSTAKARLLDYLTKKQTPCFVTTLTQESITVRANLEGQTHSGVPGRARHIARVGKDPVIACRCDPRQVPLLLERETVCGLRPTQG